MKICPRLMSYGECKNSKCSLRHAFAKSEIIETLSPVHFFIKIVDYYSEEQKKWISLTVEEDNLDELQKINRIVQSHINVDDICVIEAQSGKLTRCKIFEVNDKKKKNSRVKVSLIDVGKTINVDPSDIRSSKRISENTTTNCQFANYESRSLRL
jgi:hypothetical protein